MHTAFAISSLPSIFTASGLSCCLLPLCNTHRPHLMLSISFGIFLLHFSSNIAGKKVAANGGTDRELLSVKDWIEQNSRALLGDKVFHDWGPNLPFLFKVLSVSKALSIQAHPDKELARILHKSQPNIYKDANHKPEMALAVTEFEALCGFVSLEELKDVFHNVPEIAEVVGRLYIEQQLQMIEDDVEKVKDVLRLIFTALMSASKLLIKQALSRLTSRLVIKKEN